MSDTPDRNSIVRKLESVANDLREIISMHESIRASDDQYDDPQLWWAEPGLDQVEKTIQTILRN